MRRDVGKLTKNQSVFRFIVTIGILFMFLSVLFPNVHYLNNLSDQPSGDLIEPNNSGANTNNNLPYPGFEEGYELAPFAPGLMGIPQPPEKPHNDGIPPLTDKYKDPAYTESRTRSGGPAIVNETVLLILVNYSDVSPSRTVPELESAVFNTTSDVSSVHNFYLETSYGVCNVTPGYLNGSAGGAWLKLPQNRIFYGQDKTSGGYTTDDGSNLDGNWNTRGKGQMVRDALMAADNAGVDFRKYDNDGPDGVPNSADAILDLMTTAVHRIGGEI
jgi:hypothetical protein